jgi:hypothetical protein
METLHVKHQNNSSLQTVTAERGKQKPIPKTKERGVKAWQKTQENAQAF